MWTIFKVFVEFVAILLLFMFWFFDHVACGILAPQPGVERHPLHWKVKSQPPGCQGSTKMHLFLTWGFFSFGWLTRSLLIYPGTNDFSAHNWRTLHFISIKIWHTSFILNIWGPEYLEKYFITQNIKQFLIVFGDFLLCALPPTIKTYVSHLLMCL